MLDSSVFKLESTELDNKVSVHVPSCSDRNDKDLSLKSIKYGIETKMMLAELFGGSTQVNASGAYIMDNKEVVHEQVRIIYSFFSDDQKDEIKKVIQWCLILKYELKQECIGLEINNKFYFI